MILPLGKNGKVFWVDFDAKRRGSGTIDDPFSLPKYAFDEITPMQGDCIVVLMRKEVDIST